MIDLAALCSTIDHLSMVDVKPAGRNRWRGRCPLCDVRTGFAVEKGKREYPTWRCFGCGRYGSPLDLYAALEGITIGAAIARLADVSAPQMSAEDRVARIADEARATEGKYVIQCGKCPRTRDADGIDLAVMAAGGTPWIVSSDWKDARCPEHRPL